MYVSCEIAHDLTRRVFLLLVRNSSQLSTPKQTMREGANCPSRAASHDNHRVKLLREGAFLVFLKSISTNVRSTKKAPCFPHQFNKDDAIVACAKGNLLLPVRFAWGWTADWNSVEEIKNTVPGTPMLFLCNLLPGCSNLSIFCPSRQRIMRYYDLSNSFKLLCLMRYDAVTSLDTK